MAQHREDAPIIVRCPNCKQSKEPDYNEATHRYTCPVCTAPVDSQVYIEKRKRGIK